MLWDPRFFGVRPSTVLKGGLVAWAQMGDANASIPTPQPVLPRPMWGAQPTVASATSLHFVAPTALEIEDAIAALHRSTGMSILLVEQYVEFALRLAERYAVMEGGLLSHSGSTDSVDLTSFSELLAI